MKKRLESLDWLLAWWKLLAGVAVALIGGITVILILVMGTGLRLTGLVTGIIGGAWAGAVIIYLYIQMKKGKL